MATFLGFPFDPQIFDYTWQNAKDPTRTAIVDSGVMVEDAHIAGLVSNGSDTYSMPYYNILDATPANYDGQTDIPTVGLTGDECYGIVFGREQGFEENGFVRDYNSGANPMASIVSQVAPFWRKWDQKNLLSIIKGITAIDAMKPHVISTGAPIDEDTIPDAAVDALGDNADILALAIMHSKVARALAKKQLVEYAKYTDAQGIERQSRKIAYVDGLLTIIDDGVPTTAATSGANAKAGTYTTFLFGTGALGHANAPLKGGNPPSEVSRDPKTNGGMNYLWMRRRETIYPYGFSFTKPATGYSGSPTTAQLEDKANWSLKADLKTVPIMAVTTQA